MTVPYQRRKLNYMLEVRRLRLLREVAARGTLAAAAEALNFTPSAVSQQLAVLERETGVRLLERSGRRVRLTDAGSRLVEHAELVLAQLEQAEADLARGQKTVRGMVRLGAFPTAARGLVPGAAALLRAAHPDLRVVLHELEPHESLPAVRLGELDVAVIHQYDLLPRRREPGVTSTLLAEDPLSVALPPDHPAAGDAIRLSDLRDERWIGGQPDTSCYAIVLRACARRLLARGRLPQQRLLGGARAGRGRAGRGAGARPGAATPDHHRRTAAGRRGTIGARAAGGDPARQPGPAGGGRRRRRAAHHRCGAARPGLTRTLPA